jgi:cellulose synthase (UDP-forming)
MKPPLTPGLIGLRIIVVLAAALGLNYIIWRWLVSVNWADWWIAVPLVIAETYSLIDSLLFGFTVWRLHRRTDPPPAPAGLTVDVFITTYNEPLELVMATAEAAKRIRYPHTTWLLDDGSRPEFERAAQELGIRHLTRAAAWTNKPRHAKAGNLSNALMATDGEFLLILDADQVPDPDILDRTLGYFADEAMAIVQTPQYFVNVPPGDPYGSQAPLFYGPIQQGKDGWNAAYFCGSNAVLRREALMRLGVTGYAQAVEEKVVRTIRTAGKVVRRARRHARSSDARVLNELDAIDAAVKAAKDDLRNGRALGEITYTFQNRVDAAARSVVRADLEAMRADLADLDLDHALTPDEAGQAVLDDQALDQLAHRDWSPLSAIESVRLLTHAMNVDRDDEAQPLLPIATNSVTEDMATCMRVHAAGWRTAYHHEVLAHGLAPLDLPSMLTQRLRWAQGTIQVMLSENPLFKKGLTVPQRLMYWATMWSYFSGFAAIAYFLAPAFYLIFGVMPVKAFSWDFFSRLIPFLLINQILFLVVARGTPTWRGQQYSLALFPVWIRACITAFRNVCFGTPLGFAVTPKTAPSGRERPQWHLVRWQLAVMVILVVASIIGGFQLHRGAVSVLGVTVNLIWVLFDLAILSVSVRAVLFRPDPIDNKNFSHEGAP